MILFPCAFPAEDGPLWKLKLRSRASDNQIFVAAVSSARTQNKVCALVTYGESCVVNPDGKFVKRGGTEEQVLYYEIGN